MSSVKEKSVKNSGKAAAFMAWFAYVIIFFEMLYMASPFAVFFYSAYKLPLQFLNSNPFTGTMVQTILPHFIRTANPLINTLLFIGWPLLGMGFIVFFIGFIQIYWSKFMKQGAVTGGIYRFIRHPQYLAWSVFGLGMAILWSRIIVWVMYVTMLFVYYFLARHEEKECLSKYEDSYRPYYEKTGMFFFKMPFKIPSFFKLPEALPARIASILALYAVCISLTFGAGLVFKGYVIDNLSVVSGENYNAVSTIVMSEEKMEKILETAFNDPGVTAAVNSAFESSEKKVFYIVPREWHVPELGVETARLIPSERGSNPALDPRSHGNPAVVDPDKFTIVFSSVLVAPSTADSRIFYNTRRQIPRLVAQVDLAARRVTSVEKAPLSGMYDDIPVPVY